MRIFSGIWGGKYFLIVRLAACIDCYVPKNKIFADAHDVDALDIAACASDRRRDLAELPRLVLYLYP